MDRRAFLKSTGALGIGAGLNLAMPAISRAALTPVKFTLAWLPLGTFSYAFVAKAKGLFEQHGLDVTIDRGFGSGKVCVPVDQGQYEFGVIDASVAMNCVSRGLDLVSVAGIWPKSPVGIFSLKEKGINKPQDLEGKTVGFDVGSGDFQLWPAFVKATGIDDAKVNKVTMDAASLIKALIEKDIDAEGNFFGSIAPSLWSQNLEINAVLYEDYGVRSFSNVIACKQSTVADKPELCKAFLNGLLEGLKYVYLNPEESVQLHLQSVKEFQGGSVANQKVIEYGQAVSTALGMVPEVKKNGLGFMDPGLMQVTADTVKNYMGAKDLPDIAKLYTNQFIGEVNLTEQEWATVEARSAKYLPKQG
ncbi:MULTISPECIES: ABC transporter substrate-binding protein [unclassified Mesorhizobium]|uniref:ABC transporter substrate-binding protein n=1 Tax=unclassified Mesorhizobium TaxID=325217 RepID=UPI00112D254C|nr:MULTISPECIES: ABC transporter substrate-binding protein [unclassified Mesorhizobium]MBZ9811007.1 ABC transporter substrate-binding protein [Mesorhizobium sp. ESP-6-2]TPM27783.1 ABC transporter substrate-binding protein [Mesorhizobium sp. B2-2-2]